MKQLPIYKDFEEKSKFFNSVKIDTWEEYQKFVEEQIGVKGIYRGISSASYKIFTSLQREYITKELKGKFNLSDFVDSIRRNELFKNYFKFFKIVPSKLSIYSFLQHYGAPTPFLDFTTNYEKALYFAIENYDSTRVEEGSINDYFTIFLIKESDYDLIEIPEVIKGLIEIKKLTKQASAGYEDYSEELMNEHIDNMFSINTCNVFLIKHYEEFIDIYNSYNNIRIIAQEGLFIHNDYPDLSLEEALREFLENETHYIGSELDDMDIPGIAEQNAEYLVSLDKIREFHRRLKQNIIYSFEIKKTLIPNILETFPFVKGDIYPEPEEIFRTLFNQSVK